MAHICKTGTVIAQFEIDAAFREALDDMKVEYNAQKAIMSRICEGFITEIIT